MTSYIDMAKRVLASMAVSGAPVEIPSAGDPPEMADHPNPDAAAASLKGQAVELWRDGSRFFVVADDEDAQEAVKQFGARPGEVWTPGEVELAARISDQAIRDEVADFKLKLDGTLSLDVAEGLAKTPGPTLKRRKCK